MGRDQYLFIFYGPPYAYGYPLLQTTIWTGSTIYLGRFESLFIHYGLFLDNILVAPAVISQRTYLDEHAINVV